MSVPDFDAGSVARLAHLARLSLTAEEERRLGGQLGQVLSYFEKLSRVEVTGVTPMAHAVPRVNVTRPDVVTPSLTPAEALRNAPAHANGLFVVPRIVE